MTQWILVRFFEKSMTLYNFGFRQQSMDKLDRFVQFGTSPMRIYPDCPWFPKVTQYFTVKLFFTKFETGSNMSTLALFHFGFRQEPMDKLSRFVQFGTSSIRIYPECSWLQLGTQHQPPQTFSVENRVVIFTFGFSSVN